MLVTRYGSRPCLGCASPFIALKRSRDGGTTWGGGKALCPCKGRGQFDPIVEVVPDTGDVYALYMRWFSVVFTRLLGSRDDLEPAGADVRRRAVG